MRGRKVSIKGTDTSPKRKRGKRQRFPRLRFGLVSARCPGPYRDFAYASDSEENDFRCPSSCFISVSLKGRSNSQPTNQAWAFGGGVGSPTRLRKNRL